MKNKTSVVRARISDEEFNEISAIANKQGKNLSEVVRDAIRQTIANYEDENTLKYIETIYTDESKKEVLISEVFSTKELIVLIAEDIDARTEKERKKKAAEWIKEIPEDGQIRYPFSKRSVFLEILPISRRKEEEKKREEQERAALAFLDNSGIMNKIKQ